MSQHPDGVYSNGAEYEIWLDNAIRGTERTRAEAIDKLSELKEAHACECCGLLYGVHRATCAINMQRHNEGASVRNEQ